MQIFVMPARIVDPGAYGCLRRHPGKLDSALHAGMTQSRVLLELTGAPPPGIFKEGREGHEDRITETDTSALREIIFGFERCFAVSGLDLKFIFRYR